MQNIVKRRINGTININKKQFYFNFPQIKYKTSNSGGNAENSDADKFWCR